MAKYGMAIKLNACVGCGACAIACKTENNTEHQQGGTKFNWADFLAFTTGNFPVVQHKVIPVLCNHCTNAPCVAACPVTPDKAMFKTPEGITMHNDSRCIGCQACQNACPYSSTDVVADDAQYSVIHYNEDTGSPTHAFWAGGTAVIANGTSTPLETATASTFTPPYCNNYTHTDYNAIRPSNITEKCYFCDHRRLVGELPYCVVSCPSSARVFGDLDDPGSEISLLIASGYQRLADNTGAWLTGSGTEPNIYYIGEFNEPLNIASHNNKPIKKLNLYPNPVSNIATLEFELEFSELTSIVIYNISGREVRRVIHNEFRLLGKNSIEFNVNGLSSGTYICTVKSRNEVQSINFIVTN